MNKNYLIIGLIILALIVIGVIAAQPDDGALPDENTTEENGDTNETDTTPRISVDDQEISENNEVVIAEVVVDADGFVVVHATNDAGEAIAPESIGSAPVSAGTNEAVTVELDEEITEDSILFAMLHTDSNENGVYEYGADETGVDEPVVVDNEVVAEPFTVTVPTEETESEDGTEGSEEETGSDTESGDETDGDETAQ